MNSAHIKRTFVSGVAIVLFLFFLQFGLLPQHADAQTDDVVTPGDGPRTHIVAAGENLTSIAEQYDVTVSQLQFVNHFRNDDILSVGRELKIPGGDANSAIIIYDAQPGNSIHSIANGFNIAVDELLAANRTMNRDYMPARGQPLALWTSDGSNEPTQLKGIPHIVRDGETVLELSARYNVPVSHLIYLNNLAYPVKLYPGQRLRIPGDEPYRDLPGEWAKVEIEPATIMQGDTVTIYVENLLDGVPTGSFGDQNLNFAPYENGFAAIVGFDAFTPAGRYQFELNGSGDRMWYPFEQEVSILDKSYPDQNITIPEEQDELLDPSVRSGEDFFLDTIYSSFTKERRWEDLFQVPVTDTVVTAYYGGGRSYNEGPVTIFHTGTDFDGNIGTPILAAANGVVAFDDALELRGNTVIVDHGLGVMTGYYHLSESFVETGEEVTIGQPIGAGGSTGLSTGPHLHWDLRIMGVPVDPLRWTEEQFP